MLRDAVAEGGELRGLMIESISMCFCEDRKMAKPLFKRLASIEATHQGMAFFFRTVRGRAEV